MILLDELEFLLQRLSIPITPIILERILAQADLDGNDKIDFGEFRQILLTIQEHRDDNIGEEEAGDFNALNALFGEPTVNSIKVLSNKLNSSFSGSYFLATVIFMMLLPLTSVILFVHNQIGKSVDGNNQSKKMSKSRRNNKVSSMEEGNLTTSNHASNTG